MLLLACGNYGHDRVAALMLRCIDVCSTATLCLQTAFYILLQIYIGYLF